MGAILSLAVETFSSDSGPPHGGGDGAERADAAAVGRRTRAARRPTMKDVAALAGVSLSTVSRVVNGGPVDPALAQRVRDAARLLGYRRDHTASTLRRADRHSASIGLVWEDVSNPFFSAIHRGVEEVARERGVLTFVGSSDEDPERERALADAFSARGVDGLLIAPAGRDESYLARDREAGVELVFVDRPPHLIDADAVVSDNVGGASMAVDHLIAMGHRRIAFLGDRPAAERVRGYRSALRGHGIDEDPALVRHPHHEEVSTYDTTRELLLARDPPTALFTSQNLITISAVLALHDLGVQCEVAHVGFDDVVLADVVDPGVSVVAQDPVALGHQAAELLLSRLDGHDGRSRLVVIPTKLIERGSGELPPAGRAHADG
jgi:LacI family transcriptional regulator